MKPSPKRRPARLPRLGNPLGLKQSSLPRSSRGISRRAVGKQTLLQRIFKGRQFDFTWKKFWIYFGGAAAVFLVLVSAVFAYYVRELPNPKELQAHAADNQSTQLFDRNGKPLYSIHGEQNRTLVKSEDISPLVKQATVAVEDAQFYTHHGVNIRGIARAVAIRLHLLHRDLEGGGSSITQQYIKNALLTSAQTPDRKIKELILSIEVEQIYSKDEILTGYLNEIPYGSNAYGIQAAAQTYFGKDAKNLTLSEAATLAAIPNAPTYYSPYGNHLDRLYVRKNYILDRMVDSGAISQADADAAKKEGPSETQFTFKKNTDLVAPHFVFYVREKLIEALGSDAQTAEQQLDQAGYKVTTSIDLETQKLAQKILAEMGPDAVKKYHATNASLSAVDPRTGEILAMVGSIDYDNSVSGNTNFANARLQPGSTFKPIVYATAFGPDYHYAPGSITYDLPTNFGSDAQPYKPNNYDGKFRGPITNRQALDGSLNIPAVKNLYLAGVDKSIATAQKLGISTLNEDPNHYGLSIVLGSGEVRPIEMANAYATFANGGEHHPLRPILSIEKDGQIVKDYRKEEATKAIEPEVAYEISNVLSDNNSRAYIFGAKNNLTLGPDRPVAAKSGTTENNRDAWTIGYTPSISVAVWVGNNEANQTMVKGADGSYVAAPIWNRFMREYLTGKPVEQFQRPGTIKDVTIDKLSGKLPTDQTPKDSLVTDIFAPWQVPKDQDNVHVKVRVDKVSGKLATDLTPPDMVEERTFFSVHSEVPDNPNWEIPVQEWAKANGGGVNPPTDKDDVHVEGNIPTLIIESPANNSSPSGEFQIVASPGGSRSIAKVEFFLDNVSIGVRQEAPWVATYNASALDSGSHTIQVTATNDLGLTKSDQVTIIASKDSAAPGNPSNFTATDGSKALSRPIRLSWLNPSDSDLATVNIYISTSNNPNDKGTLAKSVAAAANSIGTADIDIASLSVGNTYYFIVRPVDTKGNENQNTKKVSAKVGP